MDWSALVRDAFQIARRGPALWRLSAVSTIQVMLYTVVVSVIIIPLGLLTQLIVQITSASSTLPPEVMGVWVPAVLAWFTSHEPAIFASIGLVMTLWAASGVFDVAATGGSISQTVRLSAHHSADFAAGMRDGFRVWWRTVGLLAIAAIPALMSLVAVAGVTLVTISIPLAQGRAPDPGAIGVGNALNSAFSVIVAVIGAPLAVLAQLGLRFVVVDGLDWKPAWGSAWRLARARLGDTVLMWLVMAGTVSLIGFVYSIVLTVVGLGFAAAVAAAVALTHSFSGAAMFATSLGILLVLVLTFLTSMVVLVWQSVAWTLYWQRITQAPLGGVS